MCSVTALRHNPEQTEIFTVTAIRTSKCQITWFWHPGRMKSSCISQIFFWEVVPASQKYLMKSSHITRILCGKFLHSKNNLWIIWRLEHRGTSSKHLAIYTYTFYTITSFLSLLMKHTYCQLVCTSMPKLARFIIIQNCFTDLRMCKMLKNLINFRPNISTDTVYCNHKRSLQTGIKFKLTNQSKGHVCQKTTGMCKLPVSTIFGVRSYMSPSKWLKLELRVHCIYNTSVIKI